MSLGLCSGRQLYHRFSSQRLHFSTLKRVKNSTPELRLDGLAALNIHYEVSVTHEEIIHNLSNSKRRMDFVL